MLELLDLNQAFQLFLSHKLFIAVQIVSGFFSVAMVGFIITYIYKGKNFERHLRHLWIAWRKGPVPIHPMRKRWNKIEKDMESDDPERWREAIFDADQMLDKVLQKIGYEGKTMEERLGHIRTTVQFPSLEDAWRTRKIRNFFVEDPDYRLTREVVERTKGLYKKIFTETGILL